MNERTLLLRQVHPSFCPQGVLSSQAFIPFPKDAGALSVYDHDQITAAEAFDHYTAQGLQSVGVWAVSGSEVGNTGLTYRTDPVKSNAAHALIDFGDRDRKACRRLAKILRQNAVERGCMYQSTPQA